MVITFYSYKGFPNTVNKDLGQGIDLQGDLLNNFNLFSPTLRVRMTSIPFNYCHIPDLNRYYFIDRITILNNGTYELDLNLDVLKTYESEILNATGTVTYKSNPDRWASNREDVYVAKPHFHKIEFPNKGLLNEEGSIIMVTIKGDF